MKLGVHVHVIRWMVGEVLNEVIMLFMPGPIFIIMSWFYIPALVPIFWPGIRPVSFVPTRIILFLDMSLKLLSSK